MLARIPRNQPRFPRSRLEATQMLTPREFCPQTLIDFMQDTILFRFLSLFHNLRKI